MVTGLRNTINSTAMCGEGRGRRGSPVTAIFRGATLVVWFHLNGDDTATFEGQDLGGYPGTSEYEYWLKVDQQALRRALNLGSDDDLTAAVQARGEEIVRTGESTWLTNHGIACDFHSRNGLTACSSDPLTRGARSRLTAVNSGGAGRVGRPLRRCPNAREGRN